MPGTDRVDDPMERMTEAGEQRRWEEAAAMPLLPMSSGASVTLYPKATDPEIRAMEACVVVLEQGHLGTLDADAVRRVVSWLHRRYVS